MLDPKNICDVTVVTISIATVFCVDVDPSPLIPASDPTPADPTSRPAAPPPHQDRPIAPQGPGRMAPFGSQICVWCRVFVSGIGGSSVLCEFLV